MCGIAGLLYLKTAWVEYQDSKVVNNTKLIDTPLQTLTNKSDDEVAL